jgi:biofilm PGA synthesis N-glycosyltransferase PgaC
MRTATISCLILLFIYPFVIYPFVLAIWAKRTRRVSSASKRAEYPTVALIICALNEEGVIRAKIENSLQLHYPPGKLTVIVISDGSTDRTGEFVREYRESGVVLIERRQRRGKIANLNEVIPSRTEEIIVLSDANVMYHPEAVLRLVTRFSDPAIGCVSGKVILTDTTPDLDAATGQYYSVEWRLQEDASTMCSMAGADGAMYALRRTLFRPCPDDTLIEDFIIPMQVISQGSRVVLEPGAIGWEKGATTLAEEFRRKVRIAAGAAQGLLRGNALPKNAPAQFWFVFVSHKLLRWLSPVTGGLILLTAIIWSSDPAARIAMIGIAIIAILAVLRVLTGWKHALVSAPFYFVFGEIAVGIGLLKGLTGTQTVLWAKEDR